MTIRTLTATSALALLIGATPAMSSASELFEEQQSALTAAAPASTTGSDLVDVHLDDATTQAAPAPATSMLSKLNPLNLITYFFPSSSSAPSVTPAIEEQVESATSTTTSNDGEDGPIIGDLLKTNRIQTILPTGETVWIEYDKNDEYSGTPAWIPGAEVSASIACFQVFGKEHKTGGEFRGPFTDASFRQFAIYDDNAYTLAYLTKTDAGEDCVMQKIVSGFYLDDTLKELGYPTAKIAIVKIIYGPHPGEKEPAGVEELPLNSLSFLR